MRGEVMTTQQPTEVSVANRENHVETFDLVTNLYRVFAERHEPVARVKYLLDRLVHRMEGHFADQETSRLFTDLARCDPAAAESVRELRREHDDLIERLKKIAEPTLNPTLSHEDWDRLEREFRDFGTRWCHHQWRETTTLIEAHESLIKRNNVGASSDRK
jgi:iron-sulfur cluster repair protein YtfE (RIC family)